MSTCLTIHVTQLTRGAQSAARTLETCAAQEAMRSLSRFALRYFTIFDWGIIEITKKRCYSNGNLRARLPFGRNGTC